MDEWEIIKKPGFDALKAALDNALGKLADYIRVEIAGTPIVTRDHKS